jgi:hypothetical protein
VTSQNEKTATPEAFKADERPTKPDDKVELDAEIVKDLDPAETADDVRGGICASSHAGVVCVGK